MFENPVSQSGERHALQNDRSRTTEGSEEAAFAAEEHRLEIAGALDRVFDPGGEGDQAAGIHTQRFALKLLHDEGATGMNEGFTVTLQALQDESLTAKETGTEFLLKRDSQLGAQRGAQESVFLAKDLATALREVQRHDLAGIRRGEGHAFLAPCRCW